MFQRISKVFVLSLFTASLVGCGSGVNRGVNTGTGAPTSYDVTGSWQIQSASVTSYSDVAPLAFYGNLQGSESSLSGDFKIAVDDAASGCPSSVQQITLTGSADASGNVTLTSGTIAGYGDSIASVQLSPVNGSGTTLSSFAGTMQLTGTTCHVASTAAIAGHITSFNGSYSGAVTTGSSTPAGTLTVSLSQSAAARTDGTYGLSGIATFVGTTCNYTGVVTGRSLGISVLFDSSSGGAHPDGDISYFGAISPVANGPQRILGTGTFVGGTCNSLQVKGNIIRQ